MNYFKSLSITQRKSLSLFLKTDMTYFRHYVSGHKEPGKERILKIIEWAKENTPHDIPTFEDLVQPKKESD